MKKIFQFFIKKLIKKLIKKSVSGVVSNPEVDPVEVPMDDSKKALWRFIIQTIINILAAVLTALGTTSCMNAL